jgi:hypothetical protein
MVATRNLKAGELIFREKALVCGPKEGSIPLCLTCYSPLEQHEKMSIKHVRCTECNIPFCSDRCANVSQLLNVVFIVLLFIMRFQFQEYCTRYRVLGVVIGKKSS